MKAHHLNDEWQIVTPKYNYWELLSYILFTAFILTAWIASITNQKVYDTQRDNAFLKAENSCLKVEIEKGNRSMKTEFDIPNRVRQRMGKVKWEDGH